MISVYGTFCSSKIIRTQPADCVSFQDWSSASRGRSSRCRFTSGAALADSKSSASSAATFSSAERSPPSPETIQDPAG